MWNRQQVKEQAKQIMKRNYWKMFVVTLIAGILSADYVTVIQTVQDFVPDVVGRLTIRSANGMYIKMTKRK
mgnify:CR=1 FL=1